jgi:signal transduction histidine kinase
MRIIGPMAAGMAATAFAAWAVSRFVERATGRGLPYPLWILVAVQVVGLLFLVAGLFVWLSRSSAFRMGPLLISVAVTWYVGDLQFSDNPFVFGLGFWLYHLNVVILAHLLLAYPTGLLPGLLEQFTIGALYLTTLVTQGLRALTEQPLQPQGWGDPSAEYSIWAPVGGIVALLLNVVVMALVIRRWRSEPPHLRRARGVFWAAVVVISMVVAASAIAAFVHAPFEVHAALLFIYAMAQLLLGVAVAVGALREQLAHRRISQFAADVARPRTADLASLQGKIAAVLEDPSLTLHYVRRNPDGTSEYVDLNGRASPLPAEGLNRMKTYVGPDNAPLAVLVHAPALTQQRQQAERLKAVTNIAGLALQNAALHADQQAHLRDVVRIEEATERATLKRIEDSLHQGPQQRLSAVQYRLGKVRDQYHDHELVDQLGPVADELQGAVDDLRALAQGIYPATLQGGLAPGLDLLVQRSPLPLVVDVPPDLTCGPLVETAYYLISEAVGNAWKHADAAVVTVRARSSGEGLVVEVVDDGCGGAAPSSGTGLRRWRDRISALGGTFELHSPLGGGTTLRVVLPCE